MHAICSAAAAAPPARAAGATLDSLATTYANEIYDASDLGVDEASIISKAREGGGRSDDDS